MKLYRSAGCRGLALLDVVVGLSLLALMLGTLAMATSRRTTFATQSAEQRRVMRDAEAALLTLHAGAVPDFPADRQVTIQAIDHEPTPAGYVWVQLILESDEAPAARSELIGLVPAASVQRWEGRP